MTAEEKATGFFFMRQHDTPGAEVLDAYKKITPDIFFLNIEPPNANGTRVLREILAFNPRAYVVMLGAGASRGNVELTMHLGARDFMAKPVTKDKLRECINKYPAIARR